jgi:hypothetical protein
LDFNRILIAAQWRWKNASYKWLDLLLARQEEAAARQGKADAEARARHERFLAILDGRKSYGKATTTCHTETTLCPGENEGRN